MDLNSDYLLSLLTAFLASWQLKTLFGLIVLDVVLGVAKSLKVREFAWSKLGDFYLTNVLPYVIGYAAVYVVIGFIIPADQVTGLGEPLSEGAVTLAWGTLTLKLLTSIKDNFTALYK